MNIFGRRKISHSLENELTSILEDDSILDLSQQQLFGIALASAYATGNNTLIRDLTSYAREYVEVTTMALARTAASQMQPDSDYKELEAGKVCPGTDDSMPFRQSQAIGEVLLDQPSKTSVFAKSQHRNNSLSIESELPSPEQLGYDTNLYMLAATFINGKDICTEIGAEFVCSRLINKNTLMTIVRISAMVEAIAINIERTIQKSHKILLVDDDVRLTRRLKLSLERKTNFIVRTENNSLNVANTAREFLPELIVLDLYMPGINGDEVLRILKADPELSKIEVIILTSLLTTNEAGVNGKIISDRLFMAKPVEDHALIDNIRHLISAGNLVAL